MDKKVLNKVVVWCCCGFLFVMCGYGLYRQHCLEQRVLVLEKEFKELRKKMQEPQLAKEQVLKRDTRDADCNCPPGYYG
ncbi:hypothetical protein K1T71_006893 [Dendrolimus kikuchii]|uniref:Uncharacterized protein n=1 Tax=Dendrolimus kikuchii TaxID=765133 RepID=A0ACC1D2B4_9NEOP|nr:hypothetical protein K1T71_006893 [Dendrolimus kikuchii]